MGKGGVIHAPLMALAVPKASKNHQEAGRFALYVKSDENQLAFSKLTVIFPSTKKAAADPYFRQQGNGPEGQARGVPPGGHKVRADTHRAPPNHTRSGIGL